MAGAGKLKLVGSVVVIVRFLPDTMPKSCATIELANVSLLAECSQSRLRWHGSEPGTTKQTNGTSVVLISSGCRESRHDKRRHQVFGVSQAPAVQSPQQYGSGK